MTGRHAVLVVAGTDSSGGAGLSRDLRVLAECEVPAAPVVTAVTAQSDRSVRSIWPVPPDMIRQQVSAALETRPFGAVKIGMLGNRATVEALVSALPSRDVVPVVLDPVLAASSGGALLDAEGMEALRALLLPNVSLLTPNIPEAAALLGDSIAEDEMAMIGQAEKLLRLGPRAVLMKGGHASGPESTDWLVLSDGEILRMTLSRSPGSVRGTGCALATAVAAGLARGLPLAYACRFAKQYVGAELADAVQND